MSLDNTAELRKGIDAGLAISKIPELRYQDALLRTTQKDYAGARGVLEELMKEYPESVSSLDLLAQTYAAQDNNMLRALQVVNDYVDHPDEALEYAQPGLSNFLALRQSAGRPTETAPTVCSLARSVRFPVARASRINLRKNQVGCVI